MVVEDYLDALKGSHKYSSTTVWRNDLLEIMKSQLLLFDTLEEISLESSSKYNGDERLTALVKDARRGEGAVHDYISKVYGSDPLLTAPSHNSAAKAQETFNIPELMEMILGYLSTQDLLLAMEVNKSFADSVLSSNKLQIKLCLKAATNTDWFTDFQYGGLGRQGPFSFSCRVDWEDHHLRPAPERESEVHIKAQFHIARRWYGQGLPDKSARLPLLGSRCRAMLICQPPIKEIIARPSCCQGMGSRNQELQALEDEIHPPPESVIVRSETGLTVGDLLDVTDSLMRSHSACPYAPDWQHHPNTGEVKVDVEFLATMALRPGDPNIPPPQCRGDDQNDRSRSPTDYDYEYREDPKQIEMDDYVKAKKLGKFLTRTTTCGALRC